MPSKTHFTKNYFIHAGKDHQPLASAICLQKENMVDDISAVAKAAEHLQELFEKVQQLQNSSKFKNGNSIQDGTPIECIKFC